MLWVTRRWNTDAFVDGDEGVNGAEGNPFKKIRVCQSKQMSFFSNIRSSPPPPRCRTPRKRRLSSKAGWAHTTCSMTAR
jgi:hypothetical protein